MDKSAYFVRPPDDPEAEFLLMLGGGMMGGAGPVFAVDGLAVGDTDKEGQPITWVGRRGERIAIIFPAGTPFKMVRQDLVEALTVVELATRQKAEQEAHDEAMGYKKDTPPPDSLADAMAQRGYL